MAVVTQEAQTSFAPGRLSHRTFALQTLAPLLRRSGGDVDHGHRRKTAALRPGYKLKLNSYDLGVDIELHDALQRIRFEHPEIRTVVVTSGKSRIFCSGANIYMLGLSTHAWKVNFCKFTNETRNGIEDSSAHSGLKFIAACNGTTAGGGYELALACDEIMLVDDRSSSVSLPELPLLGVLPGTGGLTRVIDKRKVRRDLADIFCTTPDGVRGERAKEWGLVERSSRPQQFAEEVKKRALKLAESSDRPAGCTGIQLTPLKCTIDEHGPALRICRRADGTGRTRTATITVHAPRIGDGEDRRRALRRRARAGGRCRWPANWTMPFCSLRTNELELGLWILRTDGRCRRRAGRRSHSF